MKKFSITFLLLFTVGAAHAANNCTGATYYDADTDACIACPAGYDYNTEPGKDDITDCQIHCDGGTYGGYTELQYIQTTSTLTYIDTEIVPTNYNWSAEFKVAWPQANASGLFGLSGTNVLRNRPPSYRFVYGLGTKTYTTVWGDAIAVSDWNTLGIKNKANVFHTFKLTKNGIYVNDVLKSEIANPVDWNGNSLSLYIGALNSPSGVFSGAADAKWEYAKIWNNDGVLVFDGIPARRDSDDAVGMYDRITGKFFPSEGDGTFTAGPVVQGFCASAGAGYWAAAQTVNYGSVGLRTACPVGTYSNVINATSATACTACANATYNDTPAASACKACPTGYDYNTTTGKTSASQCQIQCPAGTWNGEYTQLEYIESSGTQYIDTGIVLTSDTNEIKVLTNLSFVSLAVNKTHLLYVSYPNYGVRVFLQNGEVYNQGIKQLIFANTDYLVETTTTETQRKLAINGEQEHIQEFAKSISDGASLYSIGGSTTGGSVSAKWKYQKIYKNGVLVRDFIPVRRNVDNVIGMYDTVTGTFFTNSGTGTFTAGPDVAQGLCMNVGMGYYAPASVMNLGSVGIRNACPVGTTTVGYGHGADSANDCGRTLHVGDGVLYMRKNKETSPALHIQMENGDMFYVNLSPTNHNMSKLHLWHNGTKYTAYDDSLFYNERDFMTGASIAQ